MIIEYELDYNFFFKQELFSNIIISWRKKVCYKFKSPETSTDSGYVQRKIFTKCFITKESQTDTQIQSVKKLMLSKIL